MQADKSPVLQKKNQWCLLSFVEKLTHDLILFLKNVLGVCHGASTVHICFLFLLSLFKFRLHSCMCCGFLFQLVVQLRSTG